MLKTTFKWIDPDLESSGVLLSDRIIFYVEKVNLIHPFDEDSLEPASYTLHVGDEYYENDRLCEAKEGKILFHKNSLIYLKLMEEINMPYYMIAHHDLKVKQVYRGFLAGKSIHVDPGYSGHINYPIYNFTEEDKILKVGDPIAAIEFIKTTSFGSKEFWQNLKEIKREEDMRKLKVEGIQSYECKKFNIQNDRIIPEYWLDFGGEEHKSSVWMLREAFNKIKKDFEETKNTFIKLKNISMVAALALVLAIGGIILGHYYWSANNIININEKLSNIHTETKQVKFELDELKKQLQNNKNDSILLEKNDENQIPLKK